MDFNPVRVMIHNLLVIDIVIVIVIVIIRCVLCCCPFLWLHRHPASGGGMLVVIFISIIMVYTVFNVCHLCVTLVLYRNLFTQWNLFTQVVHG